VLTRIQHYLRVVAPIGREHEQVGPFLATFTPHSDNPYLNYALPDEGAEPNDDQVAALVDAYARRRRRPRLEYIPSCAPAVEPRLLAVAFVIEGRLPVMVTDTRHLGSGPDPQGFDLRFPTTDDELYNMALVQADAFDDPEVPSRDVVARRRAALADGALAVIAVERTSGAVVGAGSCAPVRDGLTEVAAIGVSAVCRRRGIGGALARHLGREAISGGADVPWLMAAGDGERRIYERAGYRAIGEILHISLLS
jgi:ribosomal protein S18 acetylase RimI-like enzyme